MCHYARTTSHCCYFRILQCSSQQLCVFCFLLYHFIAGSFVSAINLTHPTEAVKVSRTNMVKCANGECYYKITSSKEALENMVGVSEHLFDSYAIAYGSQKVIDDQGLGKFISDVGLMEDGNHYDSNKHDHEDMDEATDEILKSNFEYDYIDDENKTQKIRSAGKDMFPCFSSVKELTRAYFHSSSSSQEVQLSFGDFITLMPRILLSLKTPECRFKKESKGSDDQKDEMDKFVWLISFGAVLVISLVSLLGVLVVPLLRKSKALNYLISFLVALAVGCLLGDALLHLLPSAMTASDDSGHVGNDHSEGNHFDSMWKGLVVCAGIYVFFLIETVMELMHRRKNSKKLQERRDSCDKTPSASSPQCIEKVTANDCESRLASPSDSPLIKNHHHHHGNGTTSNKDIVCHHHHSHEVPQTIANIAWMVIVGDGLHNITDGLAFGVAFTRGVGIGLSTVLAVFFHEIPQELGDFAVLLNAGMTVKQALLWNFLSACTCFIGLVIGLLLGEYTSGMILWILAFTAGGFLYIALADMLPIMVKQLKGKSHRKEFLLQNIGILTGFGIMVLISLKEEEISDFF